MKKWNKKKIIMGISILVGTLLLLTGIALIIKKVNGTEAIVIPVSDLATTGFYDESGETGISGTVTDNVTQKVQVGSDDIIQEVYVKAGDQVKVGDPLIAYDMTLKKMELEIARLTQQQQENQLKKAENKLTSLENGGPITSDDDSSLTPGSTTTDSSSSGPGGSSTSDETTNTTGPTGTSATGSRGGIIPLSTTTRIRVDSPVSEEDIPPMDEITDGSSSSDSTKAVRTSADDIQSAGTSQVPDVTGMEPLSVLSSSGEAISGSGTELDPYIFFVTGENVLLSYNFAVDMIQGMKKIPQNAYYNLVYYNESQELTMITDAEGGPLTILADKTPQDTFDQTAFSNGAVILAGDGTPENPFVFYASSGTPVFMGSFLQTASIQGYSYCIAFGNSMSTIHTGTGIQAEDITDTHSYTFTNWDDNTTLTDQDGTDETSPDGASEDEDGGPVESDDETTTEDETTRASAIQTAKDNINTIKLSQKATSLNITKLEKQVANETVTAAVDGVVKVVGDPETGKSEGDAFIELESDSGLYIKGSISELSLDKLSVDQLLTGTSYESGTSFQATVREIDAYPNDSTDGSGIGNPNVSYYNFLAYIPQDPGLRKDETVQMYVNDATVDNTTDGFYIEQAYVRQEEGTYYVLKEQDGKLKKQIVQAKPAPDGYMIQILEGISLDDKIAFPYGKGIAEGTKTKDGTTDDLYGGLG